MKFKIHKIRENYKKMLENFMIEEAKKYDNLIGKYFVTKRGNSTRWILHGKMEEIRIIAEPFCSDIIFKIELSYTYNGKDIGVWTIDPMGSCMTDCRFFDSEEAAVLFCEVNGND